MFALLVVVWALLFLALIISFVDYNSDKSFIKIVLSSFECRVGIGLWALLAVTLISPIGFVIVNDFKTGGEYWMGSVLILSIYFLAAVIGWVRDRLEEKRCNSKLHLSD